MRILGIISCLCSIAGVIVGPVFFLNIEGVFHPILFYSLEAGLLIQVVYCLFALDLLKLSRYESLDTLDNDWLFSQEGQAVIRKLPPALVAAMVVSLIVWSLLGLFSFTMVEWAFKLTSADFTEVCVAILIIIGAIGVVPTIIFNLKTWNYKGLERLK